MSIAYVIHTHHHHPCSRQDQRLFLFPTLRGQVRGDGLRAEARKPPEAVPGNAGQDPPDVAEPRHPGGDLQELRKGLDLHHRGMGTLDDGTDNGRG